MDVDICVLTEVKKKGRGNEIIGEYIHIYSGVPKDARAKRGVSIAVHKKLRKNIRSWEEVDEQIIKLEIFKNGRKIVIIGVYAPSEDSDRATKDHFYNQLFNTISDIEDNKEIFILGDLNGRMVGQYGETALNGNGQRLISFCQSSSLKIMNGYFAHKDIHRFTWIQATRGLRSIIDYVLQKQNSALKTMDVRVYRSAECGSDHHMVVWLL
ncbi:craniofacial development protein 2-like [Coccinella septempunctata]|uniref:craniofacial development protein 2-like n=1 Tax=Coccinella septempunctata TaxID=41139 RepID=UPI001D08B63D|nr:craniofacial development protein 2-like [Coccinella septempunctata]